MQWGSGLVQPVSIPFKSGSSIKQPKNVGTIGGAQRPSFIKQTPDGQVAPVVQLAGLPSLHT
jgi:hypothetical protein